MEAVKRFFKDNIVYAVLMLIALQCIMYTTGQTTQVTLDQQLKILEQAAEDFQNAYIALGLNPDKTTKKDFITTPAVQVSYSAQLKPGLPFETLREARTILKNLPVNTLSIAQRGQLNDILENINISLINFLMIADNAMLQKIIANTISNRAQISKLRSQASSDSTKYNYTLQDYISFGLSPNTKITNKLLEDTSTNKITSKLSQANQNNLNRALNAITAQSLWEEFIGIYQRHSKNIGLDKQYTPQNVYNIIDKFVKSSASKTDEKGVALELDEKKLADNFNKLSKADQKAIYTLIILKPAMNIDIELEAKKKNLAK